MAVAHLCHIHRPERSDVARKCQEFQVLHFVNAIEIQNRCSFALHNVTVSNKKERMQLNEIEIGLNGGSFNPSHSHRKRAKATTNEKCAAINIEVKRA